MIFKNELIDSFVKINYVPFVMRTGRIVMGQRDGGIL